MARTSNGPYGPSSGTWPRDRNAMTHKLVTAGCPERSVGNDPSALWLRARYARALSTAESSFCHPGGSSSGRESKRSLTRLDEPDVAFRDSSGAGPAFCAWAVHATNSSVTPAKIRDHGGIA